MKNVEYLSRKVADRYFDRMLIKMTRVREDHARLRERVSQLEILCDSLGVAFAAAQSSNEEE